jgi:ribosome-interacting GTPase 1
MPANLPPQYYELEREFKNEKDPQEKLRLAQELLRMMPKHKGTDKLQADMKAKISKLKQQLEHGTSKKAPLRSF